MDYVFISLGCISRSGIARSCSNSVFNHLRDCQTSFLKWPQHFTLPPVFRIPIPTPPHVIICLFDYSHPTRCEVTSHHGFDFISLMANNIEHLVIWLLIICTSSLDFPCGLNSKESICNARDLGSIPESGRSPGEGNGNPLQYSCLGNPMDRGAWWAIIHWVAKNWTWLSD